MCLYAVQARFVYLLANAASACVYNISPLLIFLLTNRACDNLFTHISTILSLVCIWSWL